MASAASMNSRLAALCFMSPKQLFSSAYKLLIVASSTNVKPAHHLRGRRFFFACTRNTKKLDYMHRPFPALNRSSVVGTYD